MSAIPLKKFAQETDMLVTLELRFLWWLRSTWVGQLLKPIVSQRPWLDVSIATVGAVGVGIAVHGFRFGLVCALNLGATLLVRALVRAKRPVDYDPQLKQWADRGRANYGWPSIETHMAVVVYGLLLPVPLAAVACCVVGFSRLVAASRFPHQIVASAMTGVVGLVAARRAALVIVPAWRDEWHNVARNRPHVVVLALATLLLAAYLAHAAESNTSHFLSVPNAEFTRVLKSVYASQSPSRLHSHAPPDSLAILAAHLAARRSAPTGV